MSTLDVTSYVVTFHYQESGLGDLQSLTSAMVNSGYSTTLHDAEGHPHELGTNSFGIVSTLTPEAVSEQAARIAEVALHQSPQTKVTTLQQFLQNPV